jgi:aldehyde:ferredoxin oxidoreductase
MLGGYVRKILWVDLAAGKIREEVPKEQLLREYIGGYGLGARYLYDRMPAGVDPLGPKNILGFVTGPVTGSSLPTGTRWGVVGKSPLTGGWGDANASGYFGPALKQAGYDAVFFEGISAEPVYLYLEDGQAELRDAAELWGMDTYQVEDWVKNTLGKKVEAACIGPSGEKLVLISGVIHANGRAAARSGLGAVMGSKRLKMVAAKGDGQKLTVAEEEGVNEVRKKVLKGISDGVGSAKFYSVTGTPGYTRVGAENGDSPTKNWAVSTDHFEGSENLGFEKLLEMRKNKKSCWRCPIACWGTSELEYEGKEYEAHQPEYESAAAFGTNTMNNHYPSIIVSNEICNRYGLDTISAGGCIAFAIECFQEGLIDLEDTGGIALDWGDHVAMNNMLEKLARREDFGDVLAGGVKRAAEALGPEAEPFAIHVGGQELPMHDPRFEPALGLIYKIDATPGRHTQAAQYFYPPGYPSDKPGFGEDREKQEGRGRFVKDAACMMHIVNASGYCLFGFLSSDYTCLPAFISSLTGWEFGVEDMIEVGERIANVRQAFNLREGINAVKQPVPGRAYGRDPLPDGPTADIRVEVEQMLEEHLDNMGWTQDQAIPKKETLERLGLEDIAADFWD